MGAMFGPRLTTVFASRWRAIWFALSVMALAYCSVPSPEESAAQQAEAAAKKQAARP
ncbi:MAG: hypothetical protein WC692_04540 [Erythrobacter sp.]|jgi:hypothetical protein